MCGVSVTNPDKCIWILEDSTYRTEHGVAVVLLFSRNYNNKFETVTHECRNFEPYCYVPEDETDRKISSNCRYDDEVVEDALGRKVRKLITHHPSDVPKLRDNYSFTDMADFLFEKRFLVDHKIKYAYTWDERTERPSPVEVPEILEPRILFIDIETLSDKDNNVPLPQDSKYPIVSIQAKDNYTGKILVFTCKVHDIGDPDHIACANERDMFNLFLEYVSRVNPDIITAWNGSKYDTPYIIRRSAKISVNVNRLGRYGKPSSEYDPMTGDFNNRVKGRSTLDMLEAFKKFTAARAQRESYALKSVISDEDLLGDDAFSYDDLGPILPKIFREERFDEFIKYCKNDVIALDTIDSKTKLFNFYENIRMLSGCRMDDVLYNSRVIELLLMHNGLTIMPTKTAFVESKKSDFEGATVIEPIPGITEYTATFDVSSLYPTIMIGFDKSPDKYNLVVKTLEMTLALREKLRAMCKADPENKSLENQQNAVKYLNNSYYGVMGLKSFRLYNKEIAEFVTSTGREVNQFLQSEAKLKGFSVIAGDTDSVFLSSVESVSDGLEMEKYYNKRLEEWSREKGSRVIFSLKFEKLYRRILFKRDKDGKGIKKKYCGFIIWEEGKDLSNDKELNYKGLELKRSDQAIITRECLRFFLEKVLIDGDIDGAVEHVKKVYNNVRAGSVDIFDISIPKAVRRINYESDNPIIRGIKRAKNDYDYQIIEGAKPRLLYLKNDVICIDDEFDVELIRSVIDYDIMANKIIRQKLESYIWSIGYDWNTIVHGQRTLLQFF